MHFQTWNSKIYCTEYYRTNNISAKCFRHSSCSLLLWHWLLLRHYVLKLTYLFHICHGMIKRNVIKFWLEWKDHNWQILPVWAGFMCKYEVKGWYEFVKNIKSLQAQSMLKMHYTRKFRGYYYRTHGYYTELKILNK